MNIEPIQESPLYSKVNHIFDTGLAIQYGMDCAVIIHHFSYWIDYNQRKGINFHEGRTWSYQTIKDIAHHFPYLSHKQVERIINKLVEQEVLIKGNFNNSPYDRTVWYAFKDEKMFTISRNREIEKLESGKRKDGIGKPIPHNKTDIKKESLPTLSNSEHEKSDESHECVSFFISLIKEKDTKFNPTKTVIKQWQDVLILMHEEDGRPWKDIKQIISYALNDPFWASRCNTTKNLRKHATSILIKIKSPPIQSKEELESISLKKRDERIESNREYAKSKQSGEIVLRDTYVELIGRRKFGKDHWRALGYAEDDFKQILDSFIKIML